MYKAPVKERLLLNLFELPISFCMEESTKNDNADDFLFNTENGKSILSKYSKTTGQLAIALDYDKDQYNAINDKLKEMEKYGWLRQKKAPRKGVRGSHPTWYDIVYKESVFREILEVYPNLVKTMQKNDIIQSILIKKQYWIINYIEWQTKYLKTVSIADPECTYSIYPQKSPSYTRVECLECDWEAKHECKKYKDEFRKSIENKMEFMKEVFKERLILSPSFFKMCLNNSPEEFKKRFDQIYSITFHGQKNFFKTNFEREFDENTIDLHIIQPFLAYFNKLFEIYVLFDISNNEANREAIVQVSEISKEYVAKSEVPEILLESIINSNLKEHNQVY